jgi:hypothetical protein
LVAPVVEAFFDAFFHALVPGTIVDFPLGKVGLGDVGTLEVVGVEINPLPSGLAQRLFQEPPAKSKFLAVKAIRRMFGICPGGARSGGELSLASQT